MTSPQRAPHEATQRGLAKAIRAYRDRISPVETARALLSYDAVSNRLVGVTDGARTAVFFDHARLFVIEAGFDATGPVNDRGIVVASFESRDGFQEWLDGLPQGYWEWRHPRYVRGGDADGGKRSRSC